MLRVRRIALDSLHVIRVRPTSDHARDLPCVKSNSTEGVHTDTEHSCPPVIPTALRSEELELPLTVSSDHVFV